LQETKKSYPDLIIEDGGDTVRIGDLSQGCRLCKDGAWDCLFVTSMCNLNCHFCLSPTLNDGAIPVSAMGSETDLIENYTIANIKGCSYSGGEPLLDFDKLIHLHQLLRHHYPQNYFWLYTNGVLLDTNKLRLLAELGFNEIRFNTAATGYSDPNILRVIEKAAQFIENITIEIPLLKQDEPKLLAALKRYENAGVKYLNLHDLMREGGSNSALIQHENFDRVTFKDGHCTDISLDSWSMFLDIVKHSAEHSLRLSLNHCSIANKIRQISKRRQQMARIVKLPHQKMEADLLYTIKVTNRNKTICYFHPDLFDEKLADKTSHIEHIKILAPLFICNSKVHH
jgi:pyruvate formate-lyase activating enzyme-like uncharacterized protein